MSEIITVAQQGYEGSFHDIVRLGLYPDSQMLPFDDFHGVVEAVTNGSADIGIMALENSVEDGTGARKELRRNFNDLVITGERILRITQRLLAARGVTPSEIAEVRSHPIAIGQCRDTLRSRYPNARLVESTDTALAASEVAELARQGVRNVAAIGSRVAGQRHPELTELEAKLNDDDDNETRFIVFKHRSNTESDVTADADKTTARLIIPDSNNALLAAMQILGKLDINYTSIYANSFLTDSRGGRIVVPIEFTHSWHDDRMGKAIEELRQTGIDIHNLGSYAPGEVLEA